MNRISCIFLAAVLAGLLTMPSAAMAAHETPHGQRTVFDPTLRLYSTASEYSASLRAVANQINRAHVGVRISFVSSATAADATITADQSLHCVGNAGLTMPGQWIKLATGCSAQARTVILAHEFGHLLGLYHDTHCTVMNSLVVQRGLEAWPQRCGPGRIVMGSPYLSSDIAAIASMYRNTAPVALFALDQDVIGAGQSPQVFDGSSDTDQNMRQMTIDWGMNTPAFIYDPGHTFDSSPDQLINQAAPTYHTPGRYVITLTVRDSYGLTSMARHILTVNA